MVDRMTIKVDEKVYVEYRKILIDRNETVSDNIRGHIQKVVADSKKPLVY